MGAGTTGKFDLGDWKKTFIIFAVLTLVLAAVILHQPLTDGISEFFNHQQNPEFEESAAKKPASKEAELDKLNQVDVYNPDNSQVLVPNISETSRLTEPEPSGTDISESSDQNPPFDQQESAINDPAPDQKETVKLADYLQTMDIRSSRQTALKNAMELWQTPIDFKPYLNSLDDDHAFFRLTAKPSGIFIHRIESNLDFLKRLDLPAILEFYPKDSEKPGYLTLIEAAGDKVRFGAPPKHRVIESNEDEINLYWSGVAYLPWKNFLSIAGTLPTRTNEDSIVTLKLLLYELGYQNVELNSDYDFRTRNAIEEIQTRYGILADGFVGPLTKIILYKSKGSFEMPRLNKES
jgi:general secretion pathway protein A